MSLRWYTWWNYQRTWCDSRLQELISLRIQYTQSETISMNKQLTIINTNKKFTNSAIMHTGFHNIHGSTKKTMNSKSLTNAIPPLWLHMMKVLKHTYPLIRKIHLSTFFNRLFQRAVLLPAINFHSVTAVKHNVLKLSIIKNIPQRMRKNPPKKIN